MSIDKIISDINSINSATDEDQLKKLDDSVRLLGECDSPELAIDSMLGVFERFPEDDGFEVFWTVVHALESLSGYEEKLLMSLNRTPSEIGVLMINRLINSGVSRIGTTELIDFLREIANDPKVASGLRDTAGDFVKDQE